MPKMPTFRDAFAIFADACRRRGTSEDSIAQYWIRLKVWIAFLAATFGLAWPDAEPEHLDAFLRRDCNPGMVHAGRPLAQASRAMYGRMVCDWHHVLYAKGILDRDAMADYQPPRDPEPDGTPLELDDIATLFGYLDDHPDRRLKVIAGLGYFQALRMGETATIQSQHVRLSGSVPSVSVLGKGRLERTVLPLHPALVPVLGSYTYWLAGGGRLPAGTPLLQSRTCPGRPVDRKYPSRLLAAAMREAGVDGRPHDLRRTAAHQVGRVFADNPGPLQYVLRHRGTGSLRHYRQPSLGEGQQYFEAIPRPDPRRNGGS
jgi:integrase